MGLLKAIDHQLFLLVNHIPHAVAVDWFALTLSGIGTAGFIWIVLGIVLFVREERKDHWFFLPFLLSFVFAWLGVEYFLKPVIGRIRPTEMMGAVVVGSMPGNFSFPSGHASIAFALAAVLAAKEKRWFWWVYTLALLVACSRVYLGVHYPADVVVGGVLGWTIGKVALAVTGVLRRDMGRRHT